VKTAKIYAPEQSIDRLIKSTGRSLLLYFNSPCESGMQSRCNQANQAGESFQTLIEPAIFITVKDNHLKKM